MIERVLGRILLEDAKYFPVITVTGPRQSGKTTLVRAVFQDYEYFSLEDPQVQIAVADDPKGFLSLRSGGVILDEVQNVPELFSYLQTLTDAEDRPGRFVLTGSKNFLLMKKISQTLAGRCAVRHLLPLALEELHPEPGFDYPPSLDGQCGPARPSAALLDLLFTGFYPRIHDKKIPPQSWLQSYLKTYLERDVRDLVNVGDLEAFLRFMGLCAGRHGNVLNLSKLAVAAGISQPTARRWLSVLEASFLVVRLPAHHRNFNKRLVKSPKLYFLDPGLLCYLLRIRAASDLEFHSMRGEIFEGLVVAELYKRALHRGQEPDLYFWRDSNDREVDLVLDRGDYLKLIEVKSGATLARNADRNLNLLRDLAGDDVEASAIIYAGDDCWKKNDNAILPWYRW